MIYPLPSTYKLLLEKTLNRISGEDWAKWAIVMMELGYAGEYLHILAGIEPPFYPSEVEAVVDRTLAETGIAIPDLQGAIRGFVYQQVCDALAGSAAPVDVLEELKTLYLDLDMEDTLSDFYYLYHAKRSLDENGYQFYLTDIDDSQIDTIIRNTFRSWKERYEAAAGRMT